MNEEKSTTEVTESQVFEALRDVYDPEIPVNIVELGLVYDVKIIDDWVGVKMTLTTPGCGMGGAISNMARERVLDLPGVHECDIRIVWEPQWHTGMMSEAARQKVGIK